ADKPRYSLYVMVDEPGGDEYYGASVAGPIFAEIAQQVFTSDMDLVPEFMAPAFSKSTPMTRVLHQGNAQAVYKQLDRRGPSEAEGTWIKSTEREGKLEFSKLDIKPGRVPNVYGMSAKDAVVLLESLGMKVLLNGHGKVRSQSVGIGEPISGNTSIMLGLK
ncbi:MAG TPA: PASTA domain-containing protein, partial [Bacteroidia bacterium]|nr:PASTA domain-containing protein [Bacteroidia bacterium]